MAMDITNDNLSMTKKKKKTVQSRIACTKEASYSHLYHTTEKQKKCEHNNTSTERDTVGLSRVVTNKYTHARTHTTVQ